MNIESINQELAELGCKPKHIARFWFNWYAGRPLNQAKFNFPAAFNSQLSEFNSGLEKVLSVYSEHASSEKGSRLLLSAADGQFIETVLLPRDGVCVSTQIGCAVGCRFCMTGKSGLIRQLTDLEIISQVRLAMQRQAIKKVVFMGMGEPSHNQRNVWSALDHLALYARIGHKELVLSTVGDRRLFEKLTTREIKPALAISLHSAFDDKRKSLLPKSSDLTVAEILAFGKKYAEIGKYPVQYQWTLLKGVNDGRDEIERLAELWDNQFSILNMIPVNKVEGSIYERPEAERIAGLKVQCKENHILLKIRDSAAQEVDGGCGQLRARVIAARGE